MDVRIPHRRRLRRTTPWLALVAAALVAGCSTDGPSNTNNGGGTGWVPFDTAWQPPHDAGGDGAAIDTASDATGTTVQDAGGSNPCHPNPCKEPNKAKCIADGKGGHSCACNAGYLDKGDGKCVQGCNPPKTPPEPPALKPGDLLIVELMVNPKASQDDEGEWIEILNTTDKDLDLNGLALTAADKSDDEIINHCKPVIAKAGGVVVIGRSYEPSINGGYSPAYATKDYTLSNIGDDVLLQARYKDGNIVNIDHVQWDPSWEFNKFAGFSLALDATHTTASGNDDRKNWCLGTEKMSGGDHGTPGVKNKACPVPRHQFLRTASSTPTTTAPNTRIRTRPIPTRTRSATRATTAPSSRTPTRRTTMATRKATSVIRPCAATTSSTRARTVTTAT